MQRKNYHLTDRQVLELESLSLESGLSVAEIVRRAIDDFLKQNSMKKGKKK